MVELSQKTSYLKLCQTQMSGYEGFHLGDVLLIAARLNLTEFLSATFSFAQNV